MKKQLILMILGIFIFVGCERSYECGLEESISIAIYLDVSEGSKPINNVHIYGFSASGIFNTHEYFISKEDLDRYRLSILREGYTIVAVVNVGEDFIPMEGTGTEVENGDLSSLTLTDFVTWLRDMEPKYPDIMSGIGRDPIDYNGVMTIVVDLKDGSDIRSTLLRLHLDLQDGELPDYNTRVASHNLRAVAEVYRKGSVIRIHSHTEILDDYMDLYLEPGEYDVLLWVDHTLIGSSDDDHYLTSSLREVKLNDQKEYVADEETRKAFARNIQVVVQDQPITTKHVEMPLALAKYSIVATDVERYKDLVAANNYPNMEDLVVTISYEGFLPSSYDVYKNEPNDASHKISYTTSLTNITATEATICSDYIFANDINSYITVTINLSGKDSGTETESIIANIPNIRVDHLRGNLSTIKGEYLTVGVVNDGVSIDTRWDGVFEVNF